MEFLEALGIILAPSLTLGFVIFITRNWFLERLKNSIKHEYDISLEKLKVELKSVHDKELEDLKAFLKKQTDSTLEDYRFKIEIRKKWLNDVRETSIEYMYSVREQINTVQEFILQNDFKPINMEDDKFKISMLKISKLTVNIDSLTFKLETLIFGLEPFTKNINNLLEDINNQLGEMVMYHQRNGEPIQPSSKSYTALKSSISDFKNHIMDLLKDRTENL